ncbi:hypothetical protein VNI00_017976 [Paramarasmius palmivorus]|uniref:Uncharacterized protein n=1 Tax=Paramarasmius palmivorus TaxID=297713 RepID=A0AAW0B1B1_9AGAR
MSKHHDTAKYSTRTPDESLLAELGYKQEFKRDFNTLELFGLGFSIIGVLPSIASVLVYSSPLWRERVYGLGAMSELGSAAPTSGGIYYWTFKFSSERYRYFLCWIMGYINTITYIAAFTVHPN